MHNVVEVREVEAPAAEVKALKIGYAQVAVSQDAEGAIVVLVQMGRLGNPDDEGDVYALVPEMAQRLGESLLVAARRTMT